MFQSMTKAMGAFCFMSIALLLMYSSPCQGQSSDEIDKSLSPAKMKSRAAHASKLGDVYTALFYYEAIVEKEPEDLDAHYTLAELYKASRNYAKAAEAYGFLVNKNLQKYPLALFNQGVMLKMRGEYDLAKEALVHFQKNYPHEGTKEFHANLHREIKGCDSAIIFREFHPHARVENVGKGVNQSHAEFSPFLTDSNHLQYGALRIPLLSYYNVSAENPEQAPVSQLFHAEKVNGRWEETGKLDMLNDPKVDMGHFARSRHSERYYFTKCQKTNTDAIPCKIYFSEKIDGIWSPAKALPDHINLEGYTTTHPAVGLDSATNIEYLYFVSDRPSGKGGLDIWYTHYNKHSDSWAHPVNFFQANTTEMECTPYYHEPTHTMYFSSNGHISMGGLDIYKVKKEGKKVTPTKDLAFPINSPQDDFDFILEEHGKSGFFVSNRPGGTPYFHETCCDDIFSFELLPAETYDVLLQLDIVIPDLFHHDSVHLYIRDHSLETGSTEAQNVLAGNCHYRSLLKKNHVYTYKVNPSGSDSVTVSTEGMPSPAVINKKLVVKKETLVHREIKLLSLKEKPKPNEFFVLKDIQYPENESNLSQEAIAMLDSTLIPFLRLHPNDTLLIHSFTDEVGSEGYNNFLSQQRSEKVVEYLTNHGIAPYRLRGKGFGEAEPIAPNEKPDGSDNPEGRRLNRRTEFFLIKH